MRAHTHTHTHTTNTLHTTHTDKQANTHTHNVRTYAHRAQNSGECCSIICSHYYWISHWNCTVNLSYQIGVYVHYTEVRRLENKL